MGGDNTSTVTSDKQINNKLKKPWLWKPGESGNPNGRPPKGHSITEMIKEMMDAQPEIRKALGAVIIEKAIKEKDTTAIKMLWQYMDGMPQQNVNLTNHDITEVIERLESDYGEFRQDPVEQKVENDPPLQDQEQAGGDSNLQAESDAAEASGESPLSPIQPNTQG